ncbi:phosphatidylserine decarboxylase family protein [Pectinatus brassicae]|uniref:Phosphatidylserine decarboxylase proenzyme n=1 Tax=Pectinatus brassicae TaxID=862415 RepID=A0A840UJR4_9FIRM|nr:phosphatidylserine decarboxylase family protein [Pectinatus brassicae]MBB5337239.1 phosphatidylserine decarboxylase [Pectinatus brassicae]
MRIVKEGYKFIGTAAALAVAAYVFVSPYVAIVPAVLTGFFTFFFRNPKRNIPEDTSLIVSPADGKVMNVVRLEDDDFIKKPCTKITIFLSVFNVHVNRSPMKGEIKFQQYTCGRFRPAYKNSVGFENERHMIGIDNGRMRITVTQIAGILARRIISWVTLNDILTRGELYGLIKFGSCTEIVVPDESVEVLVKKGDNVIGGESIIGRIKKDE